jgi:PAS domain S-box-containing protein
MRAATEAGPQSAMAEPAPVMIWQSDPDKRSTYFNAAWLEFTGHTLEQEAGTCWAKGVHPEDVERCLATYVQAFDARKAFEMQYRLRRHDGVYRWVLDRGTQLRGDDDTFLGYIGGCIDITEHRLLDGHEREQLLAAVRTQIGEELREHASQTSFADVLVAGTTLAELSRLVRCFEQRTGIEAALVVTERQGPLSPELAERLKPVAYAALANIERSATASAVVLGLRVGPRSVTLTIQDDVGFLARTRLPLKPRGAR